MKNIQNGLTGIIGCGVLALIVSTISGCGSSSTPAAPNTVDIAVALSGDSSVSAGTPNPAATGSGTLTLNRDTGALSGSISYSGLSSPVSNAHIHAGLAGKAGGDVILLDFATIPDVSVPAGTMLDSAQMTAFLNADYYINVHTQIPNQAGELRGQILPANFQVIRTLLDEMSVTIPTGSTNTGISFLTINTATLSVRGNITNTGLDDATLAHIHGPALAGFDAGAKVTFVKDAAILALWELPDATVVTQLIMDYIMAGETYLNVHSPAFPLGEIRGQISP